MFDMVKIVFECSSETKLEFKAANIRLMPYDALLTASKSISKIEPKYSIINEKSYNTKYHFQVSSSKILLI